MRNGIDVAGYDFRGLIFDCDGTLADTAPVHYEAFRAATASTGVVLPFAWYLERVGVSRGELIEQFTRSFDVDAPDRAQMDAIIESVYDLRMDHVPEISVVADIARRYHGDVPMAVASGGQRASVVRTLKATGLFPLFDSIVTVEEVTRGKPSPELFLLAAERMGLKPGDCLVFEDSPEGLEAARRAGMACINVTPYCREPA